MDSPLILVYVLGNVKHQYPLDFEARFLVFHKQGPGAEVWTLDSFSNSGKELFTFSLTRILGLAEEARRIPQITRLC